MNCELKTALYPGTFEPFTKGHADIVRRGLRLFDRVVIALGRNIDKADDHAKAEAAAERIRALYASEPRVEVTVYTGLTVDEARRMGACCMLRGVRDAADADYERRLADVNRHLAPDIDTVILPADPSLAWISSTVAHDLLDHGHPIDDLLP